MTAEWTRHSVDAFSCIIARCIYVVIGVKRSRQRDCPVQQTPVFYSSIDFEIGRQFASAFPQILPVELQPAIMKRNVKSDFRMCSGVTDTAPSPPPSVYSIRCERICYRLFILIIEITHGRVVCTRPCRDT